MESMRRSDARRRLAVGGAKPRAAAGRANHVRVRTGRRIALARHRSRLAGGSATLAHASPRGGPDHENGIRYTPRRLRYSVLTGIDKRVETALVNASPQWLTDLTTRF